MLEIIGLYYASKTIGSLAAEKGYSSGLYRFLTFIFWFVFELIGLVIGILIFGQESLLFYLTGIAGAVGGFFFLKYIVNNLPNKSTTTEEVID